MLPTTACCFYLITGKIPSALSLQSSSAHHHEAQEAAGQTFISLTPKWQAMPFKVPTFYTESISPSSDICKLRQAACYRYVQSRSDKQMRGVPSSGSTGYCDPEQFLGQNKSLPILPCGLAAWSTFNDTFQVCSYLHTPPWSTSCGERLTIRVSVQSNVTAKSKFTQR